VVRSQLGACELCGLGQLELSQPGVEVSQGYRHTGNRQASQDWNLGSLKQALILSRISYRQQVSFLRWWGGEFCLPSVKVSLMDKDTQATVMFYGKA